MLYLTNMRLVFEPANFGHAEYEVSQFLGLGPTGPMLNLEVRTVSQAAAVPSPTGWHTLRVEAGGGSYLYQFQTPKAQEWVNSIVSARNAYFPQGPHLVGGAPPAVAAATPGAPLPSAASTPPVPSPSSAAPPAAPVAAPRPSAGAPGGATVWCGRCGKPNPAGTAQCASCGAALA